MRLPRLKEKHDWRNLDPTIKAELNKGVSIKEISKIIGLPYTAVYSHIVNRNFLRTRKYSDHINPARIVRMYRSGVKVKSIAETFGCSLKTVNNIARSAGCERRYESSDLDEILSLLEQGLTFKQVSLNIGHRMEYISRKRGRDPEFKRLTDEARAFGKSLNKEIAG